MCCAARGRTVSGRGSELPGPAGWWREQGWRGLSSWHGGRQRMEITFGVSTSGGLTEVTQYNWELLDAHLVLHGLGVFFNRCIIIFLFFVKIEAGLVLLVFWAGDYPVDWKTYCTFANEANKIIMDKCHLYANIPSAGHCLGHKHVSRLKW